MKGSGQIEQDADVILILYKPNKEERELEVEVVKNRNGPCKRFQFDHIADRFRIEEWVKTPNVPDVTDWQPEHSTREECDFVE